MAGDLLSIGKSGLAAAQAGLVTTGNNITNANVEGYSRQVVVQGTSFSVREGAGFYGSGTEVNQVMRMTDEYLTAQVRSAQSSASAMTAYSSKINQVQNLLADADAGMSPALQNFFAAVQGVTGTNGASASRETLLSASNSLVSRFHDMSERMSEIRTGVEKEIETTIGTINSYATQIADLNKQISGIAADQAQPNDLLDKRDQLILELNKQVKTTVTPGNANTVTVSIGNGVPLVVSGTAYQLAATTATNDQSRTEAAYVTSGGKLALLDESSLNGGALGGLFDFRANTLDKAQSELGRIANGLALTVNEQHKLGMDQNGNPGVNYFTIANAQVTKDSRNNAATTAKIVVTPVQAQTLKASDYRVDYDGTNYQVVRLSDNTSTAITGSPQVIDGLSFSFSGAATAGDHFLVRPGVNAASSVQLALTDKSQIAAAAAITTARPLTNKGTATISAGTVDSSYLASPLTAGSPVTLKYDAATGMMTGFPATQPVTAVVGGVSTTYAAGTPVPYAPSAGATYSVGGMTVAISAGAYDQDTFTISRAGATNDVRNASLLGGLQNKPIMDGGTSTYQGVYAGLVGAVGNKAREVEVGSTAANSALKQAKDAASTVSGVSLDEEASNLLRYQQAYQAAGKLMQIVNQVFDTVLQMGR